jgi:hypothetical protein
MWGQRNHYWHAERQQDSSWELLRTRVSQYLFHEYSSVTQNPNTATITCLHYQCASLTKALTNPRLSFTNRLSFTAFPLLPWITPVISVPTRYAKPRHYGLDCQLLTSTITSDIRRSCCKFSKSGVTKLTAFLPAFPYLTQISKL